MNPEDALPVRQILRDIFVMQSSEGLKVYASQPDDIPDELAKALIGSAQGNTLVAMELGIYTINLFSFRQHFNPRLGVDHLSAALREEFTHHRLVFSPTGQHKIGHDRAALNQYQVTLADSP